MEFGMETIGFLTFSAKSSATSKVTVWFRSTIAVAAAANATVWLPVSGGNMTKQVSDLESENKLRNTAIAVMKEAILASH